MENTHSGYCRKEKEIAVIHEKVVRMEKEVIGNGQGLVKTVPVLAEQVRTLNGNVETNNTLTSGVLRFKEELEGIQKGKESVRKRNRWLIGIAVSLFLGMMGMLLPLTIKLFRILVEIQTLTP